MQLYNLEIKMRELLEGNTDLMNLVTGVYSYVPSGTKFPYIVIGSDESTPYNSKTTKGYEITSQIYAFHDAKSSLRVKQIVGLIQEVLETSFIYGNYDYEHFETDSTKVSRDDELCTGQMIIKFRCERNDL